MNRNVAAVRSVTGFVFTVLMFTVVGAFTYLKLNNLIYNKDILLSRSPTENFYDDQTEFGAKDGLAVAFSFVDYWGTNLSQEEVAKYISIDIRYNVWGIDESDKTFSFKESIPNHSCT